MHQRELHEYDSLSVNPVEWLVSHRYRPQRMYWNLHPRDVHRAMEPCHHWLFYSDPVQLFSDCKGLLDMMDKPLADIDNRKIHKSLEKSMNYHWETVHISGEENKICDALARLCTRICFDCHKYKTPGPR